MPHPHRPSPKAAALLAAAALITAATSAAQTAPEPKPADEVVELEKLDVTASRIDALSFRAPASSAAGFRAQPILDTPFSVATFSSGLIADQQARSLIDITKNDASVASGGDPLWFDRVFVRGFYLSVDAVFRDGLAINDQGSIALENKEAIEITKGVSAARNGATSPGGTINYVLKRPTAAPLSTLAFFANGFGGYGAHLDVGGRFGVGDRFGVRINAVGEDIQTFLDTVSGERRFVSTAFDWRVSPQLLLEADFEHQEKAIHSARPPGSSAFATIAAGQAFFPRLDVDTRPTQPWAYEPNEQDYFSGRATYAFNDAWRLKLSGQRSALSRDQRSTGIANGSLQPNGDYTATLFYSPDQQRNNVAWQGVLEGDVSTGEIRHELAAGYGFTRRDLTFGAGFSGNIGVNNLFNPVFIPDPNPAATPSYVRSRGRQHALFISDTAKYSDWLQAFAALRRTTLENLSGSLVGGTPILTKTYDNDALSPALGVVVKPLAKLSLYASYSEGIEQGGTAPVTAVNANNVLDPLGSEQYEIGAKYELPAGELATLALFQIDKGLEFVDAANRFVQDGRQVHDGVELTFSGAVNKQLRLLAGITYLDARTEKTVDLTVLGKRPQGVPEWMASLFADHDLSALLPGFSINGGVYYVGEKAVDRGNLWLVPSSTRFDLGLRYQHRGASGRAATYRLGVSNVTDKRYVDDTSFGSLTFGEPRAVSLSANYEF
jgi:iron complex outermembrane receptor protein